MLKINEYNFEDFLDYYNDFHNKCVTSISYDIFNSKIELLIDASSLDYKIDTNGIIHKTKLRMVFNDVQKCNINEMYPWDFIQKFCLKFVDFDGDRCMCFTSDEEEPIIYIVCLSISYEEEK